MKSREFYSSLTHCGGAIPAVGKIAGKNLRLSMMMNLVYTGPTA